MGRQTLWPIEIAGSDDRREVWPVSRALVALLLNAMTHAVCFVIGCAFTHSPHKGDITLQLFIFLLERRGALKFFFLFYFFGKKQEKTGRILLLRSNDRMLLARFE